MNDKPCYFCKSVGEHEHYTVIVRDKGVLLGRLTPDGHCTTRKVHAAIMSHARAIEVADAINENRQGISEGMTAKVAKF